jgi:hypothetical protein
MREYLVQLRRLGGLGAKVALPAHGAPIDAPAHLFDHYVTHRLRREEKVLSALRAFGEAGARAETLVPKAYDDTPEAVWPFATRSLLAHLGKLEAEGLAFRRGELYVRSSPS